jgi:hypothetical protein
LTHPQNIGPDEPVQIQVRDDEWVTIAPGNRPSLPERGRVYGASFGDEPGSGVLDTIRKYVYRGRRHFDQMVVRRKRLARLALVGVAMISVALLASALVIRAAAPEADSAITGSLANRVPIWVYPPVDSAASDAPVITPDPVEPPDQQDDPPFVQLPQGGGGQASGTPPPSATPGAKRTPTPASLRPNTRRSVRLATSPDRYLRHRSDLAFLDQITGASPAATRESATFTVVRGLAKDDCYSFRDADGRYLRHFVFRMRYDADDGSQLFRQDATFCARSMGGDVVAFESVNYWGRFIRHRGGELFLDSYEFSPDFMAGVRFEVTSPWA